MKEQYRGYSIEVRQDEEAENPRVDRDHDDLMVCFHRKYQLGDACDYRSENFSGWDALRRQLIQEHDPVDISPLFLYDHSGLTISMVPFACPWDSGQIGYILMPRAKAKLTWPDVKDSKELAEKAREYLKASVEEYDRYLRGEIYFYEIRNANGDTVDSCGGFDADMDDVLALAKESVDALVTPEKEETTSRD